MLEDEQRSFQAQTTEAHEALAEPAWPPPPRPLPRQGPSKTTRVLTIALAVLLVVGGLSAIIYATTNQYGLVVGAQRRLDVNATVRSQVASQATLVSSLQATAQPLATTQAGVYASATAQDQSTATTQAAQDQATATATTLGNLLTQDTTSTPTLNDPLSDNSLNNGWDEVTADNQSTGCTFTGTAYEVQEGRQGFFQPCFATATTFTNFVYQVSMTMNSGSQGGMIFCANKSKGQYYLFRIDINGGYALELYNNGKYILLVHGTNAAITTGVSSSNTLTVIANKGTFSLFVNTTYVDSASDTTLSGGQIGMAVIDRTLPTTVDFSNAEVWKLP
ncbi:MAG: hypothetical protein ABI234_01565 [Ktedonobacteraceae bacterium]